MNEITSYQSQQLPDTLDDLTKFALIGREKLNAVRAEIRAIERVGLAKEVHEQKLHEAQEIAEAVLDAEMKIGELTARIPKATTNHKSLEIDSSVEFLKPKSEAIQEIGLTQKQAERYEKLARHPEIVERVKAEARKNNDIVSRSAVLHRIQNDKKLEAIENSGNEFLKQQVRDGKATIDEAFRVVTDTANKSPAQSKKEFLDGVKKEREEFQEQKESGIVSVSDIHADNENRKMLADDLYLKILHAGKKIDDLFFDLRNENTDIRELASTWEPDQAQKAVEYIAEWIRKLNQLKEVISI